MHHIIEAEAQVIRMIFDDYLSGMGKVAISNKFNEMKIPTRLGGQWAEETVRDILRNERYIGDLLLQKTYVEDHLSKRKRVNTGELPRYYVEDNHPAIIGREVFARVWEEMKSRAARFGADEYPCNEYPFTGKMVCGQCGQHYQRKIASAGSKYEKPVWICQTFNRKGKEHCPSQQVPEDILMDAARQVLGLPTFDEVAFEEQIFEIRVPGPNLLVFIFWDGHEVEHAWAHHSRKWSEEAKQQARERYYNSITGGEPQ